MFLWDEYQRVRISPEQPSRFRHAELMAMLSAFQAKHPESLEVTSLGKSVEGRDIKRLQIGTGPKRVLAWSQMHGNEPTHTAVLVDLLNFLLKEPTHPSALEILSQCTLVLIPMLNPDGAERNIRRNAQDIDVNRDALHLQSPEGRLLRQAVKDIRPQFALNLHNQRPSDMVGNSGQVAAVSLLVPPLDAEDTQTEQTIDAKKIAVSIMHAIEPTCQGMISRYPADFMPRCFGEWVQQQGVATVTLEAGGWSSVDASPLVQLHCVAVVRALEAIATDDFLHADPAEYDRLPRTGEHDLFGLLIQGVTLFNGRQSSPFVTDLGINFHTVEPVGQGVLEDLGDLSVTTGKEELDGKGLVCLPGRIVAGADVSPENLPDHEQVQQLLSQGVTSVIGRVDISSQSQLNALDKLRDSFDLPINIGFVAAMSATMPAKQLLERKAFALSKGVLGTIDSGIVAEWAHLLDLFQVPRIQEHDALENSTSAMSCREVSEQTARMAKRLELSRHGSIQLGAMADLVLIKQEALIEEDRTIDWSNLQQVLVGGNLVFKHGQLHATAGGTLLKGRLACS